MFQQKGNDKELPLLYTVSADYVMPVPASKPDQCIKDPIISLTTENNVDEDSASVVSSEQDFEDGGISEISNQESKKLYHKSLLDSLQLDDEFTEWWKKERVEKPKPEIAPTVLSNGLGLSGSSIKDSWNTQNAENGELPAITNGHAFEKDPNNNAVALCNGVKPSSVKDSLSTPPLNNLVTGTIKSKYKITPII